MKFRRRGITHQKACNIQNTAKVLNQEHNHSVFREKGKVKSQYVPAKCWYVPTA